MDNYMMFVWLGIAVFAAVGEAASMALTSVWFVGGSIIALVLAVLGAPIWVQTVVFFVVSGVLLAVTRPLAKKYINARAQATNLDRIIGETCRVTEEVDNREGRGEVYVDGKRWSARSESDEPVAVGAEVEIIRIEGVKVIVRERTPAAAER